MVRLTRGGREDARLARFYADRVEEQDASHPGYARAWRRFTAVVLQHGGAHVVPPPRPDPLIDMLVAAGRVTERVTDTIEGEASECHRNAVALWRSGSTAGIGTGYALSEDGLWREHSWGVAADGGVVETTVARLRYFGVTMTGDQAEWFASWIEG